MRQVAHDAIHTALLIGSVEILEEIRNVGFWPQEEVYTRQELDKM